jgi:hypothetical protein
MTQTTQTLDAHERLAPLQTPEVVASPPAASVTTPQTVGRFGTFAITFGIAFAILYTVLERLNWPLFTYHPAVNRLDFWMARPRSGEGPPMYWFGWLALSITGALVVSWIAAILPARALLRATIFCCVLAAIWPAAFAIGVSLDGRASFDSDVAMTIAWVSALPALVVAAAAGLFIPLAWAERLWLKLLLIVPLGAFAVLAFSLRSYFLR